MATRPDVLIIPGISMMLAAKKLKEEKEKCDLSTQTNLWNTQEETDSTQENNS